MGFLRVLIAASLGLLPASVASGQNVELGPVATTSCTLGEGGCNPFVDSDSRPVGPFFGFWFGDFVEVGTQVARVALPDIEHHVSGGTLAPFSYQVTDRSIFIVQAEAAWHFFPGSRVRPFVATGAGGYRTHRLATCEPAGCEPRLRQIGPAPGALTEWRREVSAAGGVSVLVHPRVRVRAGMRHHYPWRGYIEEVRFDLFLTATYRFGKR